MAEGETPSLIITMAKRKIIIDGVKKTFSVGYGELKKDIKTTSKKLKPKLKKNIKKRYKRKTIKQIKDTLGYNRKLNLGGIY